MSSLNVDVPVWSEPPEYMMTDLVHTHGSAPVLMTKVAEVRADGLLLYVSEASYQPGTSPLSSWIQIAKYEEDRMSSSMTDPGTSTEGPLNIIQRFVHSCFISFTHVYSLMFIPFSICH
jgi:hypothetical protein